MKYIRKTETRIQGFLSHRPVLYALIVGTGIILFWRGIWHTADALLLYAYSNPTIDLGFAPWWDGPLSILVGFLVLLFGGAFVSSFIGNELIIAGLRGEKKLSKKIESEERTEVGAIGEIKQQLADISATIEKLETKLTDNK